MAQNYSLSDGSALIIERNFARPVVRRVLSEMGFREIIELNDLAHDAADKIDLDGIDLIIANVEDDDLTAVKLVKNLRRRLLTCNPFAGIILTCGSNTASVVQTVVDSGSDGILLKPYAPIQIQEQITAIIERRRPFIVTADYIGPERRGAPRAGSSAIPYFEVTNSLRVKALRGEFKKLRSDIEDQWNTIDRAYCIRLAFQIFFLIRVMQTLFENPDYAFARKEIARLPSSVKALTTRLRRDPTGACQALNDWLARYPKLQTDEDRKASRAEAERTLSDLLVSLDPQKNAADISAEIDGAVGGYLRRLLIPPTAKAS